MADTPQSDKKAVGAEGYLVDHDKNKKPIIIAFGGIAGQIHQPLFEFKRFMQSQLDCHFIYLKDMKQSWYQKGVVGLGEDIPQVAQKLRDILKDINHTKVITIGSSMGGYASLLFGHLIGADHMLAFGPQTFICEKLMEKHGDHRLDAPLSAMRASCQPIYTDLAKLHIDKEKAYILYGTCDSHDNIHAEHMNVRITALPGDHGVVKRLRDNGTLLKIIAELIV